jgi:ABC-type polysaccharide/polyol phosphate transport system ATPase subunit
MTAVSSSSSERALNEARSTEEIASATPRGAAAGAAGSAAAPRLDAGPAGEPSPAPPPALIELRQLGVWYRLHRRQKVSLKRLLVTGRLGGPPPVLWALRGITFTCHEHEVLGIVGHNGAGKSTLCLVLAQILTPDEGTAHIRGRVSTLLTLGAGFNRELTGRANIQLYAAFLGIPREELDRKMERIIEFSELGDFIDEPVRAYSTGMRARLGFSVAATLEPEILILDEVLAVGDRAFRAKSRQRILDMMAASRLIVIVSHSTNFLREVCTHCLWLDHGTMKQFGPAGEVLKAYERAMGGAEVEPGEADDGL